MAPHAPDPLEGLDDTPEKRRSEHTKKPSMYIQRIHAGEGMATGLPNKPVLPQGVQDASIINVDEYALSSVMEEALGGKPQNEKEARLRKDWPMWEDAMKTELARLEAAGTWTLVEKPSANIVRSRWVY